LSPAKTPRSGGVAAADQVTRTENPVVMLSQDTQEGIASLQRYGPGHAKFNNRSRFPRPRGVTG
jgi:hypothetical protein